GILQRDEDPFRANIPELHVESVLRHLPVAELPEPVLAVLEHRILQLLKGLSHDGVPRVAVAIKCCALEHRATQQLDHGGRGLATTDGAGNEPPEAVALHERSAG